MSQPRSHVQTRAAFELAYRERRRGLLAWAASATRNLLDAEDILQDVFLGALSNIDGLTAVENIGAWLFTAVRNRVVDRKRSTANRRRLGESDVAQETIAEIVAATGFDPHDELVREELSSELADAIDALPDEQRQVVVAQAIDGLTFQELAELTGTPVDTLASRKRYAIKKLAAILRDWVEEE